MRIEQLEYLAVVARLGSFRRAAEELHVSQPALSEAVRSLERELGVELLERGRHGARVRDSGRELMPRILTVLDSVDRLRQAAGEQYRSLRTVRVGTVTTATAPLLAPAIRQFRHAYPNTQVEVVVARHDQIHDGVLGGSVDLGLVNYLAGDDMPPQLEPTTLLRGHPVVCVRSDSPLAARDIVTAADLASEPFIAMRSGYVMHRYIHRLLREGVPAFSYAADGAEMGKLLVAEGLGLTVLPDFSVRGDPLERQGIITWRPITDDHTEVTLVIERARSRSPAPPVRDLHRIFVQRALAWTDFLTRSTDDGGGPVAPEMAGGAEGDGSDAHRRSSVGVGE